MNHEGTKDTKNACFSFVSFVSLRFLFFSQRKAVTFAKTKSRTLHPAHPVNPAYPVFVLNHRRQDFGRALDIQKHQAELGLTARQNRQHRFGRGG